MGTTNLDKAPDARPEAVIRQLPPAAGVRHGALVEDAADEVDEQRNEEDDAEDAAGADATGLVRLDAGAGMQGPHAEEVGALVGRVDKRDGRLAEAVASSVYEALEGSG